MKQKMRSKGESCCGEGIWGLTDKIQRETERISELRSVTLICSGRLSPDVGGWGKAQMLIMKHLGENVCLLYLMCGVHENTSVAFS